METISQAELHEVAGGFGPPGAALGAAVNLGFYSVVHLYNGRALTWRGAVWAAGTGAAIGATGGALMAASGGGIPAALAWRPGMMGTNFGLGQVSRGKGW